MKNNLKIYPGNPQVINSVLKFNSISDFQSTILKLQSMDIDQIIEWEKSIGFNSMFTRFQKIIEAEWEHERPGHSSMYNKALEEGFIRRTDQSYELNIFNPGYSYILNNHAIVMIKNDLLHITNQGIKIWKYGDPFNPSYLTRTHRSGTSIKYVNINYSQENLGNGSSCWSNHCKQLGSQSRFSMTGKYYSRTDDSKINSINFINYLVSACTEINIGGTWKIDPWAFIQIRGSSLFKLVSESDTKKWKMQFGSFDVAAEGGCRIVAPFATEVYPNSKEIKSIQTITLENAVWRASSKSLTDEWLSCSIST